MTPSRNARGFTLVEVLVVVAIIGILASTIAQTVQAQVEKAKVSATAADLKTFETGFVSYATDHETFPNDYHLDGNYDLPAGAIPYLPVERWSSPTPLGGNYNWEGPDFYPYAGISFFQPEAPASAFARLDDVLDDGNLGTGKFRVTGNGRYTYVIDE